VDDLESNKALIRTYWEAVNVEDYATLESIHDPAARNHAPAAFDLTEWPSEGKPFGPVEVRETYRWIRSGQPDLHVDVEALIAEDDQVVAWVRATSTLTGTGGPIPPTGRSWTSTTPIASGSATGGSSSTGRSATTSGRLCRPAS